ncbi:pyridoxamine 5'-phosphate oxidase family protein [Mangrovicoccus algicola]|uniref:Pyridoxamine 5'-phosphate oxidase family protein n=1 Tax=Mangrovicoccus algicola TaxID=2771008 RepID=A0A8J6Z1F6_9RHOB|nr:pyridoxamine 5'-phosphate oxidase family protein [Mangrovicoccus algicola]MBE3639801.1 pyridoxamine 5'-phosphate oxidase family protein [Mangrovicoccus algicola]
MNAYSAIEKDPRSALSEQMEDLRAGMLGLEGSAEHMQPMTHFPDWAANEIWFLTSKDTDMVRGLAPGQPAKYVLMGTKQDFHASLRGTLTERMNRDMLEKIWSPVAAAWFHGGKDDPSLTMLCLRLESGQVWGSTDSTLRFGFEIARANMDEDRLPDIGTQAVLTF